MLDARRSRPGLAALAAAGMAALALTLAVVTAAERPESAPASAPAAPASAPGLVPYPEGYRTWVRVKSLAIVSDAHPLYGAFGGLHHVYVNGKGLEAARQGKRYPDGSILVFDLHETSLVEGAYAEGERKFIGIMHKDANAYGATGGWGFEGFKGDSKKDRMVNDPAGQCFGCHAAQKKSDYVFSEFVK